MQYSNYIYFLIVLVTLNFSFIVNISACIFNIFLYLFGTLDNVHLKLSFFINHISSPRPLYYSLVIYQIIAINIFVIIASVCYTSYLLFVKHMCCQLNVLKYVFNVEIIFVLICITIEDINVIFT